MGSLTRIWSIFARGFGLLRGTFYYLLIVLTGMYAALIVFTNTPRASLTSSWSDSLFPYLF